MLIDTEYLQEMEEYLNMIPKSEFPGQLLRYFRDLILAQKELHALVQKETKGGAGGYLFIHPVYDVPEPTETLVGYRGIISHEGKTMLFPVCSTPKKAAEHLCAKLRIPSNWLIKPNRPRLEIISNISHRAFIEDDNG